MKITKLIIFIYLFSCIPVTAICAFAESDEGKKISIIGRRINATVCIGIVKKVQSKNNKESQKSFVPIGTGVIIAIPNDPRKRVCLVTAKHVFEDPIKNWHPQVISLRFAWHQHLPLEEYHGVHVRIRNEKDKLWYEHPEADLASIPILISTELIGKKTVNAIKVNQFLELKDLSVGEPVLVLGFPGAVRVSLGSSFMTLPLARHGIISWLPPSDLMTRAILVDTMAFPGNSGGPVFNQPRIWDEYGDRINKAQPTAFIGIVSKAALQPVDVMAVEIKDKPIKTVKPLSLDYMGLTQIEPADRVKELLDIVVKNLQKGTEHGHAPDSK